MDPKSVPFGPVHTNCGASEPCHLQSPVMPNFGFRLHPAFVSRWRWLRVALFLLMLLTASWFSFVSWGGLFVFGGRVKSPWEFLFFALPVAVLPITLLAMFLPRVTALLLWLGFAYVALFILKINWPHVLSALGAVLFPLFRLQLLVCLLCSVFAYLEKRAIA